MISGLKFKEFFRLSTDIFPYINFSSNYTLQFMVYTQEVTNIKSTKHDDKHLQLAQDYCVSRRIQGSNVTPEQSSGNCVVSLRDTRAYVV